VIENRARWNLNLRRYVDNTPPPGNRNDVALSSERRRAPLEVMDLGTRHFGEFHLPPLARLMNSSRALQVKATSAVLRRANTGESQPGISTTRNRLNEHWPAGGRRPATIYPNSLSAPRASTAQETRPAARSFTPD